MNPEITIYLEPSSDDDVVENFKNFIVENNLSGIQARLERKEPEAGTLSGGEYLPLIKMLLGSTVVATTVKSLFDIIKKYFELQESKTKAKTDVEKAKINAGKVQLKLKNKEGKDVDLTFTAFDQKERDAFFKNIDEILK
jgi:hypothetical protein